MSKLLAPNGKPSNLNPEQYKLVRTPAFKKWFGDWENDPNNASKVLDKNGEPLVCYHGTGSIINVFDKKLATDKEGRLYNVGTGKGVFSFTDDYDAAKGWMLRSKDRSKYGVKSTNMNILEVFLNFKNPIDRAKFEDDLALKFTNYSFINSKERDKKISQIYSEYKKQKIDGLISDFGEYTAFYPSQIKLADGTNITFEPNNPDIRYKQGGKVKTYWYKGLFESNYFEKLDNYKEGGNIDKEYNDYVKRVYDLAKFNANLPKGYGLTLSDESRENYNKKNKEIEKLVKIALENNYEVYYNEKQKVIYFIIDNIQISFHTRGNNYGLPHTNIFWDGVKNSYKYKKNRYDALKQKRLDIISPKIELLEKKEKEFIEKGKKQLEIWEEKFNKIPEKEKQAIYRNDSTGFHWEDKRIYRKIESLKSSLENYDKKDPYNNKRPKLGYIDCPFNWHYKYDKKDIYDWNNDYFLGDIAHELNKMYKKGYHTPEVFTVG